ASTPSSPLPHTLPLFPFRGFSAPLQADVVQTLVTMLGMKGGGVGTNAQLKDAALEGAANALVRFTLPSKYASMHPETPLNLLIKQQQQLAELGAIPQLVTLLVTGNAGAKRGAALCLGNFSESSPTLSVSVKAKSGGCCFKPPEEPKCVLHGGTCSVRASFCLLEAEAIDPLVGAMGEKEPLTAEAALTALSTLMADSCRWEASVKIIHESGGFGRVVQQLSEGTERAKEKGVWMLEKLFRLEEYKFEYATKAQGALIEITQHGSNETKPVAAKILSHLELLHQHVANESVAMRVLESCAGVASPARFVSEAPQLPMVPARRYSLGGPPSPFVATRRIQSCAFATSADHVPRGSVSLQPLLKNRGRRGLSVRRVAGKSNGVFAAASAAAGGGADKRGETTGDAEDHGGDAASKEHAETGDARRIAEGGERMAGEGGEMRVGGEEADAAGGAGEEGDDISGGLFGGGFGMHLPWDAPPGTGDPSTPSPFQFPSPFPPQASSEFLDQLPAEDRALLFPSSPPPPSSASSSPFTAISSPFASDNQSYYQDDDSAEPLPDLAARLGLDHPSHERELAVSAIYEQIERRPEVASELLSLMLSSSPSSTTAAAAAAADSPSSSVSHASLPLIALLGNLLHTSASQWHSDLQRTPATASAAAAAAGAAGAAGAGAGGAGGAGAGAAASAWWMEGMEDQAQEERRGSKESEEGMFEEAGATDFGITEAQVRELEALLQAGAIPEGQSSPQSPSRQIQQSGSQSELPRLPRESVMRAAAGVLAALAGASAEGLQAVVQGGAVEEAASLLSLPRLPQPVRSETLPLISAAASLPSLRPKLASMNLLPPLLTALYDPEASDPELEHILSTLCLMVEDQSCWPSIIDHQAVPRIAAFLAAIDAGNGTAPRHSLRRLRSSLLSLAPDPFFRSCLLENDLCLVPLVGADAYRSLASEGETVKVTRVPPSLPPRLAAAAGDVLKGAPVESTFGAGKLLLGLALGGNGGGSKEGGEGKGGGVVSSLLRMVSDEEAAAKMASAIPSFISLLREEDAQAGREGSEAGEAAAAATAGATAAAATATPTQTPQSAAAKTAAAAAPVDPAARADGRAAAESLLLQISSLVGTPCESIVAAGGVPPLVALLATGSLKERAIAAEILGNVIADRPAQGWSDPDAAAADVDGGGAGGAAGSGGGGGEAHVMALMAAGVVAALESVLLLAEPKDPIRALSSASASSPLSAEAEADLWAAQAAAALLARRLASTAGGSARAVLADSRLVDCLKTVLQSSAPLQVKDKVSEALLVITDVAADAEVAVTTFDLIPHLVEDLWGGGGESGGQGEGGGGGAWGGEEEEGEVGEEVWSGMEIHPTLLPLPGGALSPPPPPPLLRSSALLPQAERRERAAVRLLDLALTGNPGYLQAMARAGAIFPLVEILRQKPSSSSSRGGRMGRPSVACQRAALGVLYALGSNEENHAVMVGAGIEEVLEGIVRRGEEGGRFGDGRWMLGLYLLQGLRV
ncbi:unnamed protein product, partial [Closterium sp. NIES-54]